jgi:molybdopterin-binding protein
MQSRLSPFIPLNKLDIHLIQLPGGSMIAASITKTSVHSLGLKSGDKVSAIIKASNVIVGVQ